MAEVYVDGVVLVAEGDSNIVFVSDEDRLFNVLVGFSPLDGEKILDRVELLDEASDVVNVEWVGTLD